MRDGEGSYKEDFYFFFYFFYLSSLEDDAGFSLLAHTQVKCLWLGSESSKRFLFRHKESNLPAFNSVRYTFSRGSAKPSRLYMPLSTEVQQLQTETSGPRLVKSAKQPLLGSTI